MLAQALIPVIAATFTGMVLGALWYSPLLFGKAWMAAIGKTPETLGSQTLPMVGSIVASLLMASGVALLLAALNVTSLSEATAVGAILGFLIIFPALLSDNLFCGWGKGLLLIQAGYRVLTVVLMAVVIFLL
ncbi:hypothetical protein R50073_01380 [Maricurvus nonylphenolicus]|uniref:DUF1761 domain-containing protein n=1 Tax=Maricurvus nonylphenolicus TaxID=1008307 RepID=UPI0036F1AC7A